MDCKSSLHINESSSSFVPVRSVSPNSSQNQLLTTTSTWGKSLQEMLLVTIKDIEKHRLKSGKTPDTAIIKTLDD